MIDFCADAGVARRTETNSSDPRSTAHLRTRESPVGIWVAVLTLVIVAVPALGAERTKSYKVSTVRARFVSVTKGARDVLVGAGQRKTRLFVIKNAKVWIHPKRLRVVTRVAQSIRKLVNVRIVFPMARRALRTGPRVD